jgi:RHS repeat-associated protein
MGTVRYTVVDGEVLSELRGGVKRDYVPDPLGSTVALLDSSQNITDTFSYWPYGESAGRTGTTPTPFQYVGRFGYYTDSNGRIYIRARYLDRTKGRWITFDSIYPFENAYEYSNNRPVVDIDPSGAHPALIGCGIGAVWGGISGWLQGGTPESIACRAGISCISGALLGAIGPTMPWLAKCLLGALGAAGNSIAVSICSPPPKDPCTPKVPLECSIVGGIASALIGCAVGGAVDDKAIQNILKLALGAISSSMGSICSDIYKGRDNDKWHFHPSPP